MNNDDRAPCPRREDHEHRFKIWTQVGFFFDCDPRLVRPVDNVQHEGGRHWDPSLTYFGTPSLILQFRMDLDQIGCVAGTEEKKAYCFLTRFADVWVIHKPDSELMLSRVEYWSHSDETWVEFGQVYDGNLVGPVGVTRVVINGDNEVIQVQSGFRPNINLVNQGNGCAGARYDLYDVDQAAANIAAEYGLNVETLHLEEESDVVFYNGFEDVNEAWAAKLVRAWADDGDWQWSEICGFMIYVDAVANTPLNRDELCAQ